MATSTNVKIGKQPRWNDELQYFVFGTNQKMNLIMADRLAAHGEHDDQLFVEAEIDLAQFLSKKNKRDEFSNWYNLKHDGKNCGSIHFCFEFEARPLTPEEQSMEHLPMAHMYDDVFKQWAHHAKSCHYHESHSIPVNKKPVEDAEMHTAPDDGRGCMGMTRYDVATPFDRMKCAAEALKLGFRIKDPENQNGCTLIYKDQEVITDILASYDNDGDYIYYEDITVYVWNEKVLYSGYKVEVGGDRPGMSYFGTQFFCCGTLVGDRFIEARSHSYENMH